MPDFNLIAEPAPDEEEYYDLNEVAVLSEDGDPVVTFHDNDTPAKQFRIEFDLDRVRVHQLSSGDVVVTLK